MPGFAPGWPEGGKRPCWPVPVESGASLARTGGQNQWPEFVDRTGGQSRWPESVARIAGQKWLLKLVARISGQN